MASSSGGFYRPALPVVLPRECARKCIVCGTTKLENELRPFLLKDERLNVWSSNYFRHKPQRRVSFYSKLRYTMNPFACVEHFSRAAPAPPPVMPKAQPIPRKTGRRTCEDLLAEGEEPPSIEKITERKPSPPPEGKKDKRSEGEVNDAVMNILKKAVVEMKKEGAITKALTRFTRKAMHCEDFEEEEEEPAPVVRKKVKVKKRGRKQREKQRVVDGNEADSDNSTVDVEAIDTDEEEEYEEESSEEETDIEEVTPPKVTTRTSQVAKPKPAPLRAQAPPLPRVMFVPRRRPPVVSGPMMKRYVIAAPPRPPQELIRARNTSVLSAVPKRLTLTAGSGNGQRISWVPANPGQRTLASILQSVWNEDGPRSGGEHPSVKRLRERLPKRPFVRKVLPGTRTRFIPAALAAPSSASLQLQQTPSATKLQQQPPSILHPSIRASALLSNPPLSPSRLIIASEETVETTLSDTESKKGTAFCSSSSEGEEVDVDVCGNSSRGQGSGVIVEGQKIEGEVEEKSEGHRSRTISIAASVSTEVETESSEAENTEVDVETVEEPKVEKKKKKKKKREKKVEAAAEVIAIDPPPPLTKHTDRRKQRMPAPSSPTHRFHRLHAMQKKFVVPPTAAVKPPTKLLSAGKYSVKEALHAEARAAAVQPVRIDTTGLLAPMTLQRIRPKDMPRLQPQLARKRQSEWSRLEEVVERKAAAQKALLIAETARKLQEFKKLHSNADDQPPMLEQEGKRTFRRGEDRFPLALIESLAQTLIGKAPRRSKVLRIRFHKKDEAVDVRTMKVLDGWTRPQGVVREEEVAAPPALRPPMDRRKGETLAMKEREAKRMKVFPAIMKVVRAVARPSLVIDKEDVMEAQESLNAPPPTPIVGIPDKKAFLARREMYEQQRHEMLMRTGVMYDKLREIRDETLRKKIDLMRGIEKGEEGQTQRRKIEVMRGIEEEKALRKKIDQMEGMERGEEDKDEDEEDLEAEAVKVLKMIRAEEAKNAEEAARKRKRREAEKDVLVMSDIENDEEEEEEEMEEGAMDEKDYEWRMNGAARKKMEEIEEDDGNRRKSHRLREKKASGRKWDPIWMKSDDEELIADTPPEAAKRKRGRPRKNPEAPPPKKKREESRKLTAEEKAIVSRVFPLADGDIEEVKDEEPPKIEEEKEMEREECSRASDALEMEDAADPKEEDEDMPMPLERQAPKAAGDHSTTARVVTTAKRARVSWSWKQRLEAEAAHGETGARLCQHCLSFNKRYVWIANEPLALMDHARTHCVETLMCPSKECTYMNTTRARISQHVTYVHKRWGMPIDLSEVYSSLRASLTLRLRQCFPDLPNLSVCQLCRVAVGKDADHRRWHAQTHLETRVFQCSRDICMIKFHSEQECYEHIQNARCHGSIVNGMTDEMDAQVTVLEGRCFGTKLFPLPNARKAEVSVVASDGEAHSATVSSSTSRPCSQMESEENEEMTGPSRRT